MIDNIIQVKFLSTDEEIIDYCKDAKLVAIDSPLSMSKGFREVDKKMIRSGYKVLPPSFMKSLVERAIRISKLLPSVIETHPTSSMKNLGINWKEYTKKKDEIDAVICAITAYAYDNKMVFKISDVDGIIYLLPKAFPKPIKVSENYYILPNIGCQ
ncbi:hypothetical protein [Acidianus sp. HS-5]|uniref:DUF429 domain-containing protein n=1 Tax=Acidianus sp. HS-5 TaxID=2886040 RepID=UPI001F368646|nr:hypothetical protein [Acidianus sp. HS-5]BDC19386.1 hypothetical protein HS5_22760 [Acidianus sp. HS-5]